MVTLGKSGLRVTKISIGTVPLQRLSFDDAVALLQKCLDGGIRYFDTSDNYGGSDAKLGKAVRGMREQVVISTKVTPAKYAAAKESIKKSLEALNTDYIDLIQFHNPKRRPDPNDDDGAFRAVLEAKAAGLVHHIGYTTHNLDNAIDAVRSGLFEVLQYPLNYLSGDEEDGLVDLCRKLDVGLIAMKPFAGGMITEPDLTFHYFQQRENVVPIYGIQRERELEALINLERTPPSGDADFIARYEEGRKRFAGQFCRGCGICDGICPEGILVSYMGRIGDFFYRNPPEKYLSDDGWYKEVKKVEQCKNCGACVGKCRFGLDMKPSMKRSHDIFMSFWDKKYKAERMKD